MNGKNIGLERAREFIDRKTMRVSYPIYKLFNYREYDTETILKYCFLNHFNYNWVTTYYQELVLHYSAKTKNRSISLLDSESRENVLFHMRQNWTRIILVVDFFYFEEGLKDLQIYRNTVPICTKYFVVDSYLVPKNANFIDSYESKDYINTMLSRKFGWEVCLSDQLYRQFVEDGNIKLHEIVVTLKLQE